MLFISFTKGPGGFPYVFIHHTERSPHWNQYMAPLLLTIGSLSLGETSRFLMILLPLKWVCMPYLPQIFLILLHETLCVRYNNVILGFNFIGSRLGTCGVLVVSPIKNLPGRPVKPSLPPCLKPIWDIYTVLVHS